MLHIKEEVVIPWQTFCTNCIGMYTIQQNDDSHDFIWVAMKDLATNLFKIEQIPTSESSLWESHSDQRNI